MVPESLNEVDEKELRLIEFKPEDGRESVVRVFREEFEENRRAEGGVRRCLALSARLKRGRNMQMDAGGRYAAVLGRRQPGSCALGGAAVRRIVVAAGWSDQLSWQRTTAQKAQHRRPSTMDWAKLL